MTAVVMARPAGLSRRIASPTHGSFDAMLGKVVAVDLGCVLGPAIGVVDTARRRLSLLDRDGQGGDRQSRVDGAADGMTHDPPGPGIQNDSDINEATDDGDVGDIGDPKLVGAVKRHGFGKVGKIGWSWSLSVVVVKRRRILGWRSCSRMRRRTFL
jgi:hypothetical protein